MGQTPGACQPLFPGRRNACGLNCLLLSNGGQTQAHVCPLKEKPITGPALVGHPIPLPEPASWARLYQGHSVHTRDCPDPRANSWVQSWTLKQGNRGQGPRGTCSKPPLSSLLKPPYPGQSWAGCRVPELSLTLPDPQGLCFQSSNQNRSLHPAHIRPGALLGARGTPAFLSEKPGHRVPVPSYVPSPHPYSCDVPPLSPSPHGHSPLHPASAQPLLDPAPASGLHTWLQIRSPTDQVTPSLRPLHGSLLRSVSFKRAPRTMHDLAALSPALDPHSHTWLCHFQNVFLLGRQNISQPPGEPTSCCVMSFSKQDFLFANGWSWGPHPKENYLLLTLTPRHSQDPSEHGEAP